MLAFGQHNLGLCGDQRPFGPVWGLRPSFGAFGPVLGPLAQFGAYSPVSRSSAPPEGGGQTNTQTEIL